MNITNTFNKIFSSNLKNTIGPLLFHKCWYSPRRLPLRNREDDFYNPFRSDENFPEKDIAVTHGQHNDFVMNKCPTEKEIRLQCQSTIEKTAEEWKTVKEQEKENLVLPSEKIERESQRIRDHIKICSTIEELFYVYKKDFPICTEEHCILIVEKLAEIGVERANELHDMVTFKTILFYIWKTIRTMSIEDIMNLLDYLTTLKVQTKSLIFQSLLQMAKYQINYMNALQLISLDRILSCHLSIPLVVALRTAIKPMMANECQKAVAYSVEYTVTLKIIEYCHKNNVNMEKLLDDVLALNLAAAVQLTTGNRAPILYKYFKTILMPKVDRKMKSEPYEAAVNFLLEHIASDDDAKALCLQNWDELLPRLLTGLSVPLSPEAVNFLNEICANFAQMNPSNMQKRRDFINDLATTGYHNTDLLDDIIKDITEKVNVQEDILIETLLLSYATPSSLGKEYMQYFTSYDFSNISYKSDWLQAAVILLLKNQCPEKLLQNLFSSNYLSKCLEDDVNMYDKILNLNRIINLLPDDVSIPISAMFKSEIVNAIADFPFERTEFRHIMGIMLRNKYICDVVSNKNILIDYMILLDSKDMPINIQKEKHVKKIKYIILPPHTQKIAILEIPFSFNPVSPSIEADVRILEDEGFRVALLKEELIYAADEETLINSVLNQLASVNINIKLNSPEKLKEPKKMEYRLDVPEPLKNKVA